MAATWWTLGISAHAQYILYLSKTTHPAVKDDPTQLQHELAIARAKAAFRQAEESLAWMKMEESLLFGLIMWQEVCHVAILANTAELDIRRLWAGLRSLSVSALQSTLIDSDLHAFLSLQDLTTPFGSKERGAGTQNCEECIMEELGAGH